MMHGQAARRETAPCAGAIDDRTFRNALGRFASGVTVVTTRVGDRDHGSTVSAFSSVSLQPPLILCCFRKESETVRALLERRRFAVCLLASGQAELARRFAASLPDRFAGIALERTREGMPLIAQSVAHLVCNLVNHVEAGDHVVVFGGVDATRIADAPPLVVFRGAFGSFLAEPAG
jgi:4-nitrophenol 2-monooxygenase / 4-nitrocatechol 4-monooxygenase, reductase component